MSWLYTSLQWYIVLLALGLIFFPITRALFGKAFYDSGYAFSKIIGVVAVSYTAFVLGTYKVLPFTQTALLLIILVFAMVNLRLFLRQRKSFLSFTKERGAVVIFEELLFLASLIFWVWVRGQEPSIRDLEKMMDFGFINSILRSSYFPPPDIWLAGHTINYYYFGHLTGAVLTKLSGIPSVATYNLILATLFALGVTEGFSLCFNLVYDHKKTIRRPWGAGILGAFLLNFAGNLHTIYLFTKGYPNDKPLAFWKILSWFNPSKYWYPNATRFIPFTIHEFPIYSYVVADLHGHVFDIPIVLLTLAILLLLIINRSQFRPLGAIVTLSLGFLTAVHYMTNAFDGPIYLLLTLGIFLLIYGRTRRYLAHAAILIASFFVFSFPFTSHFSPFVSGIGVNCAPQFLIRLKKLGPFLFEAGKCQTSPLWMMLVLWGFFLFNFLFFLSAHIVQKKQSNNDQQRTMNKYILVFFTLSTILLIIPEFFYIKDIYPAHFRANTMFKLGYQAFIMMTVASVYVFVYFKSHFRLRFFYLSYFIVFIVFFSLIAAYPVLAISSYYGSLKKTPLLAGDGWIKTYYPEYQEIIDYLNANVKNQPTILEAQGDSYTTFNVVSSYTGLPTVAGWWVHEWLWRGSSTVVGKIIPDIETIYQSNDVAKIIPLIRKYHISFIIVGSNERTKYKNIAEDTFSSLGSLIFSSSDGKGKIYRMRTEYTY